MASLGRSPLPMVTIVPFDVKAGQTINVNDFLRGLKRPALLSTPISGAASSTPDSHDAVLIHDGVAPDSSMLNPPKSCPIELPWEDKGESPTPIAAESWTNKKPIAAGIEPMKALEVSQTYTNKTKLNMKAITEESRILEASKQHGQWTESGAEQESLQETVEHQSGGDTAPDYDLAERKQSKRTKGRKKKRSALVNELALVPSLLAQWGSPAVKVRPESLI